MKFIIVSSRQHSGGSIVLHRLAALLNENGHTARVFYKSPRSLKNCPTWLFWILYIKFFIKDTIYCLLGKFEFFNSISYFRKRLKGYQYIPIHGVRRKILPFINDDDIVIYPDVCYGNFLSAKKVVRWLLFHNRFPGDKNAYGEDDLFFAYRDVFNDESLNPEKRILHCPFFNLELYRQTNFGTRLGTCYVIRKGQNRTDLPEKFDGLIIDDLMEHEKVKVFNSCQYCISYDTQTAYSQIAALCGCISIVVPEPGKTVHDYRKAGESLNGVAWSFDSEEISRAKATIPLLREAYDHLNNKGKKSVLDFIQICENRWGKS